MIILFMDEKSHNQFVDSWKFIIYACMDDVCQKKKKRGYMHHEQLEESESKAW
jgi:hypothetical protein